MLERANMGESSADVTVCLKCLHWSAMQIDTGIDMHRAWHGPVTDVPVRIRLDQHEHGLRYHCQLFPSGTLMTRLTVRVTVRHTGSVPVHTGWRS